jgi:hypothetical protein
MQAQQQLRIKSAPLAITAALIAVLALGATAGYALRVSEGTGAVIPVIHQVVPQFPAATQPPMREPQNSYD